MQYLIAIVVVIFVIYLIIQLLGMIFRWILSITPAAAGLIATLLGAAIGIALLIGFLRGSFKGITGYYSTLTDVYGKKVGVAIGVVLTLVWLGVLLFFGHVMLSGVIEQFQALSAA